MKNSKKATSIIEAIVVLLIITTGVTGMYKLFINSTKLSNSITNKIQAIQIAKQGIEGFTNIRDTNWLRFSSDYINCWNTDVTKFAAGNTCIGDSGVGYDIDQKSYIIYRSTNNSWELTPKTISTYGEGNYITNYRVGLNNGIYTQTGTVDNLFPVFTREIIVSYLKDDGITVGTNSNEQKIKVTSLVQWADSSSSVPHKIKLDQILSNWKQ